MAHDKYGVNDGENQRGMCPELPVTRGQIVKRQDLENEGYDDTKGRSVNQDLINRKAENARDL